MKTMVSKCERIGFKLLPLNTETLSFGSCFTKTNQISYRMLDKTIKSRTRSDQDHALIISLYFIRNGAFQIILQNLLSEVDHYNCFI